MGLGTCWSLEEYIPFFGRCRMPTAVADAERHAGWRVARVAGLDARCWGSGAGCETLENQAPRNLGEANSTRKAQRNPKEANPASQSPKKHEK